MPATETIERLKGLRRRPACSDAERRAAVRLHDDLRSRGHEAWVETYWVRPQWAASLLLHATLGVAASLAATAAPYPALGVALATALSYGLEIGGHGGLLKLLFYRRATQVVVVEPPQPEKIALIVTARTDSPRGGLVFRLRRLGAKLGRGPTPTVLAWVVLALFGVAVAAAARAAGAEGPAVGAPQFVPTVLLLLAAAAALDAALSGFAPSKADDEALAVAVEIHDELVRNPPAHLSPALLLAGAGTVFPFGFRAHVRRERPRPESTVVLELRPTGPGSPAYSARAGVFYAGRLHHQIAAACEWTKAELPDLGVRPGALRGPSATQIARARGLPAVGVRDGEREATLRFCLAMVDVLDADLGVQPD
jgi:hypothetical protein